MSHLIIVKGGRTRLAKINVSGDLSKFYEGLDGVADHATNGCGRAELTRVKLAALVGSLPSRGPDGRHGIHILKDALTEVLTDNPEIKKFILHCS